MSSGPEDVDEAVGLIGADGLVGQQTAVYSGEPCRRTRANMPGEKSALLVGDDGARAQGAGALVEAVVEEVELARVGKALLVGQADADRRAQHAGRALAARFASGACT